VAMSMREKILKEHLQTYMPSLFETEMSKGQYIRPCSRLVAH
jgi:hypothetical protein